LNDYLKMQKAQYAKHFQDGKSAKDLVGNYEWHERYPYEDYLLAHIPNPEACFALDFGCGEGRMIRRMAPLFRRIDGVDISPDVLAAAECPGSQLYVIDGQHLDGVQDDEYDLVYSTIAFQHVASYAVRKTLLKEFARVLRPGGKIALQSVYSANPKSTWNEWIVDGIPFQHIEWTEAGDDVTATNGLGDAVITSQSIAVVERDLEDAGITGFHYLVAPPPHRWIGDWIFLYGTKV